MFSATDIASFLACPHTATLARAESKNEITKPFFNNPTIDLLQKLGLEHEQRYLCQLAEKNGLVRSHRPSTPPFRQQPCAGQVKLVQERIPERFRLDPIRDVQVLCPMNRGSPGVRELNAALQKVLNPARPGQPAVERFGWRFQIGDKVIQTKNDYDKDVFNGDFGIVERIDAVEQQIAVRSTSDWSNTSSANWTRFRWLTRSRSTSRRGRSSRRW
jgi:ATP-dependent RecD-like DNA helicase SH3 domain